MKDELDTKEPQGRLQILPSESLSSDWMYNAEIQNDY